jgi:hypothetical protein
VHSLEYLCYFVYRDSHIDRSSTSTLASLPFVVWGLNLVRPLQKAPGASPTYLSPSTSSQNGSRLSQSCKSNLSRRCSSLSTSVTALGSQIPSSPTMTRSSSAKISSIYVIITISAWIGQPWCTPRRTGRSSAPTT